MTLPDDSLIHQAVTKLTDRLTARLPDEQNSYVRGGLFQLFCKIMSLIFCFVMI